jgi:HSP20 family protein
MSLVRYEPWTLLNQLHSDINRLYEGHSGRAAENGTHLATSDWVPAVDIKEEDGRFLIHADVPGVKPDDIEVHMENGVLTISGRRESESAEEREGYKRVERVRGSFYRRFSLPDTANAEAITAKCADGVLEVVIPKQEKTLPKRIKVEG